MVVRDNTMTVTVFGLGFVGLTTAVGFADAGIKVYGVEVNAERANLIASGKLPFHEPGLDAALVRTLGNTFFVVDGQDVLDKAIQESDCIYYCVGTPYGAGGEADLTYLYSAIDTTLAALAKVKDGSANADVNADLNADADVDAGNNNAPVSHFPVLVTKSTIPPSTTSEKIIPYIEKQGFTVGVDLGVANNPEFLREGFCWEDFTQADRVVLGVSDVRSEEVLKKLYSHFSAPVFAVSLNTGEYIKYLSNTLLATLISYSNEMAALADTVGGIDIAQAFKILHMDRRWGNATMTSYVYPGCGYGGYCLPKDTNAIYALAKGKGYTAKMLGETIHINDERPVYMAQKITEGIDKGACVGVLGLSFKPDSDDVRDTPAAKVIKQLIASGFTRIIAYDPLAIDEFKRAYDIDIEYVNNADEVISQADVVTLLTAWDEFRMPLSQAADAGKPVYDFRYMMD